MVVACSENVTFPIIYDRVVKMSAQFVRKFQTMLLSWMKKKHLFKNKFQTTRTGNRIWEVFSRY